MMIVSDFVHWNGMNVNIKQNEIAHHHQMVEHTEHTITFSRWVDLIVTSPLPLCQVMWMDFVLSAKKLIISHMCLYVYPIHYYEKAYHHNTTKSNNFYPVYRTLTYHSTCITIINTHLVMLPIYRSGNRQCGTNQFLIYNRISTHFIDCIYFHGECFSIHYNYTFVDSFSDSFHSPFQVLRYS